MSEYGDHGTKFGDMSVSGKCKWTLKFLAAVLTFGFAFPNVMHD